MMCMMGAPRCILVVRNPIENDVIEPYVQMLACLVQEKKLSVYVEEYDMNDLDLQMNNEFTTVKKHLMVFNGDNDSIKHKIDLVICLGGDRTVLHTSSLFQCRVPPVMAFNVKSNGFLTPFKFERDFPEIMPKVMEGNVNTYTRHRLQCVISTKRQQKKDIKSVLLPSKRNAIANRQVLNEVVLNRGHSSIFSTFQIFVADRHVTTLEGDGLILSTPTGSTAYAVSAGASMVHPNVPCVLITPVCPHSLSFRPIIIPAGVSIKIRVSSNAKENIAMVSFDGRDRVEMGKDDTLSVITSPYPLSSICNSSHTQDWFDSLSMCMDWNQRRPQKSLLK